MLKMQVLRDGRREEVQAQPGATLGRLLNLERHTIDLPCGGLGRCHRCRVVARGRLSPPTAEETAALGSAELAAGVRFACQARALGDVQVELLREGSLAQVLGAAAAVPGGQPLYTGCGVAVDLGTTTLAAQLYASGQMLAAASAKNPQTAFGADVLTRIGAALDGKGDALAQSVRGGVAALLRELCQTAGVAQSTVDTLVLVGNTTMQYLLCGQNPKPLSHAPFAADRLFGETLDAETLLTGLAPGAKAYLPRCVSAFVGADITAAILASGLHQSKKTALLADIGTNGEIVLSHKGRLLCCSTAAGPACEGEGIEFGSYGLPGAVDRVWLQDGGIHHTVLGGGKAKTICGSGIIDALAVMLRAGVVDETGAFCEAPGVPLAGSVEQYKGQPALRIAPGVLFTAGDVRKLQLAKGAIRAGMETLLQHAGVDAAQVETLYIAGGFGNYLNIQSAAAIGLVPLQLAARAVPIGNAALAGAAMLLQNAALAGQATALAKAAQTVDLGASPAFMDNYMQHMMFEDE